MMGKDKGKEKNNKVKKPEKKRNKTEMRRIRRE